MRRPSQLSLHVLAPDLVRVRAAFQKPLPQLDHSWAIARTEWPQVLFPDTEGAATGELYEDDGKTQAYLNGVSDHFTLKFRDGKITSTSSKDNLEKSLPGATINVHHGEISQQADLPRQCAIR